MKTKHQHNLQWIDSDSILRLTLIGRHDRSAARQICQELRTELDAHQSVRLVVDASQSQYPELSTFSEYIKFLQGRAFLRVAFIRPPTLFRVAIATIFALSRSGKSFRTFGNESRAVSWLNENYTANILPAIFFSACIFFAGAILTVWLANREYQALKKETEDSSYQALYSLANNYRFTLRQELESEQSSLYAAHSLVSTAPSIGRSEWAIFNREMLRQNKSNAIRAMEYAERVNPNDIPAFIDSINNRYAQDAAGYPALSLRPETPTTDNYIVTLIEPIAGNEAVFGFNLYANESRRRAIDLARDTSDLVISEPIQLLQEPGKVAVLQIYPQFNGPTKTLIQRRENFRGVVVAVTEIATLAERLQKNLSLPKNTSLRIQDVTEKNSAEQVTVYQSDKNVNFNTALLSTAQPYISLPMRLGTRIWEISFLSKETQTPNLTLIYYVLIGGGVLSCVLSLFVFTLFRQRDIAELKAKTLNAELLSTVQGLQKAKKETAIQLDEAERMNKLMTNRELTMIQLKKEIQRLRDKS